MAGFEVVVRPVVFPNIRPAPAQSQAPASDPTKDIAVIHGSSGQHIDLPFSWTVSTSSSRPRETKRRVDVARVYQKDDAGNVNRDNFMDVDVANRIWMNDGGNQTRYGYTPVQKDDNVEIREKNKIRKAPGISDKTMDNPNPPPPNLRRWARKSLHLSASGQGL